MLRQDIVERLLKEAQKSTVSVVCCYVKSLMSFVRHLQSAKEQDDL